MNQTDPKHFKISTRFTLHRTAYYTDAAELKFSMRKSQHIIGTKAKGDNSSSSIFPAFGALILSPHASEPTEKQMIKAAGAKIRTLCYHYARASFYGRQV